MTLTLKPWRLTLEQLAQHKAVKAHIGILQWRGLIPEPIEAHIEAVKAHRRSRKPHRGISSPWRLILGTLESWRLTLE
jgi:hypothetical protein